VLADLARDARFRYFDEPLIVQARDTTYAEMNAHLDALAEDPERPDRSARVQTLVACAQPLATILTARLRQASPALRGLLLEVMTRRYYRMRPPADFRESTIAGHAFITARYMSEHGPRRLLATHVRLDELGDAARAFASEAGRLPEGELAVADFYAEHSGDGPPADEFAESVRAEIAGANLPASVRRVVVAVARPSQGRGMSAVDLFTFRPGPEGLVEDEILRGLHPMMGERLELWRLSQFALERLPSSEDLYLFHGVARKDPKDERLFALAEVRDLTPLRDDQGRVASLPELERMLTQALEGIRRFQAHRRESDRLLWNRVVLHAWPVIELSSEEIRALMARVSAATLGLGLEMVMVRGRVREPDGEARERLLRFFSPAGHGVVIEVDTPPTWPIRPLDEGARRIVSARRRGTHHPAEIVKLLAPARSGNGGPHGQPRGEFIEHDLDEAGRLVPVDRPPATNSSGIVTGLIRNFSERYPEGMDRVLVAGDPTRALGSLAEPECRRIIAALELAEALGVPLEWFAVSAGAKIAMDSGTENMDWIAAVLRRIVEFTQAGGELNVVVTGINVGAQPYWNAEATMLMHTSGILVMTPESAMVLTGKQALDYSGGVSAEDNFGIGGYERIMGPNGQAQYWAPDLASACSVLLSHYEHTYVAPGERFPRQAATIDPRHRDVRGEPHSAPGSPLRRVGDIFSDETNPGRKLPFDIRAVMRAVVDEDHPPLERWAGMREAESAVVWDAHLGGWPVAVLGIESHPLPRYGQLPADGPDSWTSGTLFPRSSKKIARAVNAASGRRPVVVLANLAGFDGSPESMREWQLEFGAEIGRAVTNFRGPIVFCVISRYHGGAFVVFSQRLNDNLETFALEGAKASVIGGAPAAAVVFARDVNQAALHDPRIAAIDERIAAAGGAERQRLRAERALKWTEVRNEKVGEFAATFDAAHSVERAVEVGSVRGIVPPAEMRPFLIDAVERGMRRTIEAENERAGLAEPIVH
jgi:acetyl-CoA carboxylase carboxyltransferase component